MMKGEKSIQSQSLHNIIKLIREWKKDNVSIWEYGNTTEEFQNIANILGKKSIRACADYYYALKIIVKELKIET